MLTTALYDGLVHFLGAKLVSKTLPSSKLVSGQGSAISENLGRGEVQSINTYVARVSRFLVDKKSGGKAYRTDYKYVLNVSQFLQHPASLMCTANGTRTIGGT